MSRKNNKSRIAKKQKRKQTRKAKRSLKKMESAVKFFVKCPDRINVHDGNVGDNVVSIDEEPSTSKHCKRNITLIKSPRKSSSGKINKFKKFLDDQRRSVGRTVYLMKDNQAQTKKTEKNTPPQLKCRKRRLNNTNKKRQKRKNGNLNSSLEEGEIPSDSDRMSCASSKNSAGKKYDNDEDDCIVIEPTLEEIIIHDTAEDDMPSTSYQSLINSFNERMSSTPCHSRKSPQISISSSDSCTTAKILPFYVDLGPVRGTESINSTENFTTDYSTLSTLNAKYQLHGRTVRLNKSVNKTEVIELLDDCSNDSIDVTLKRSSNPNMGDDSVVFVSETNKNDFIPIVDENILPHRILKVSESSPKTPVNKLPTNNLFTQSETKKLNEYNENAYNPNGTEQLTSGKRMVIIDGSNVAFKHGLDQEFSVKGLQIAIEYFEKRGHEVKAVIPQFRMNKSKSTNSYLLEKLHKAGKIVQTPCKNLPGHTSTSYDDRFILQLAFATDAAIVSNDNYRDLLFENPSFKKIVENRVIGYTWCNDIFILPKDPYGKWGPSLSTILNRS